MTESVGLSIGAANLVAACSGGAPVVRRPVLRLFDDRPSEVGLPADVRNPGPSGVVVRGFVERVGDPAPLTAPDGTKHLGEELTAEALDAMARAVGYGTPTGIAVPAYWSEGQVSALRRALAGRPALTTPGGMPPVTVSDTTAALADLHAKPGFPTNGVVALCDFGASGTSVTLTDAAANFRQIGPTNRHTGFSGDRIDHLILTNLQARAPATDNLGNTAPMGPVSRRLDECRRAKEELSAATMTVVPAEMPGFGQDVQLSRTDFEQMISGPLDQFITAVEEMLQRNGVPATNFAAAAIVGGGACIPLVTARLSERLQAPIFTTRQPASCAAVGAGLLTGHRATPAPPTAPGAAPDTPTEVAGGQLTEISPAGWAVQAANDAAAESAVDDDASATYRALAWSQDAAAGPVPYLGEAGEYPDDGGDYPDDADPPEPVAARRRSPHWYARPTTLIGLTGATAIALIGAVVAIAFELTAGGGPTETVPTVTSPVQPSAIEQQSEQPSPPAPVPSSTIAPSPTTSWTTTVPTTPPTTTRTTIVPTTTAPTTYPPTTTTYPSATTSYPYPPTTTYPYPTTPQETAWPTTPTASTGPGGY